MKLVLTWKLTAAVPFRCNALKLPQPPPTSYDSIVDWEVIFFKRFLKEGKIISYPHLNQKLGGHERQVQENI